MQVWCLLCSWLSRHNGIVGCKNWMWYFPSQLYVLCKQYIAYLLQVSMTLCAKLHTAPGQMSHCHTLLMQMQIATYLKTILTLSGQAISVSVVRLLISGWMDNEKEAKEMDESATFISLFGLLRFLPVMKSVLQNYVFSILF